MGGEPIRLIYIGRLPKVSNKRLHPMARYRLTKAGRRAFGAMPPRYYPTTRATVQVVRVLGPGQKPMDRDNLAILVSGLIDALKPSYIVDDSEVWSDITYTNDGARREQGPRIEFHIRYDGEHDGCG
jgi:hypothetical protein